MSCDNTMPKSFPPLWDRYIPSVASSPWCCITNHGSRNPMTPADDTSYRARHYILLGLPVISSLILLCNWKDIGEPVCVLIHNQSSQGHYSAYIIFHIEVLFLYKKDSWLPNFKRIRRLYKKLLLWDTFLLAKLQRQLEVYHFLHGTVFIILH